MHELVVIRFRLLSSICIAMTSQPAAAQEALCRGLGADDQDADSTFVPSELIVMADSGPGAALLPVIIRKLEGLHDAYRDSSPALFEKVTNARRLFDSYDQGEVLQQLLLEQGGALGSGSQGSDIAARRIMRANAFLLIDVNPVPPSLEFQFYWFCLIKSTTKDALPTLAVSGRDASLSVIINPNDANYSVTLDDALARFFPQTNRSPTSVISVIGGQLDTVRVDSVVLDSTRTRSWSYNVGRGDTIRISAAGSDDPDTPRARFRYAWRQINPKKPEAPNVRPEESLGLDASDTLAFQTVVPRDTGTYWIGVRVSDQVKSSKKEAVAVLHVIEKPRLKITPLGNRRYRRLGLLDRPLDVVDRFAVGWTEKEQGDALCLGFRGDPPMWCQARDSIVSPKIRADTSELGFFAASDSLNKLVVVKTATFSSQELIFEPQRQGVPGDRQVRSIQREWAAPIQVAFVAEWLFGRSDSTLDLPEGAIGQVQRFSSSSLNLAMQLDVYITEDFALMTSIPLRLNQGVGLGRFLPDIGASFKPVRAGSERLEAGVFARALPTSEFFLPAPVIQPDLLARGRTYWYLFFGVGTSYRAGRVLRTGFELGLGPGLGNAPEDLLWDLRFSLTVDFLSLLDS